MENDLIKKFKTLKLGTISDKWQEISFESKEQFLSELLDIEIAERDAKRITKTIKRANLPVKKSLKKFKWSDKIRIPDEVSSEKIESLDFIKERENLILLGNVGTGKTHLAMALAEKACKNGIKSRFYTAASLGNELIEKRNDGKLGKFMKELRSLGLIIIDEIGFVMLHKEAAELIFQVVSECYEQRSLIITSNLEFSQWNAVFGDNKLTAALIDRLVHHSHILVFTGESHRLKSALES
jgi:DNA replication protein DnaC